MKVSWKRHRRSQKNYGECEFSRFGLSEVIRHDRELEIMLDFFCALYRITGQKQRTIMIYRTQSNDTAEIMCSDSHKNDQHIRAGWETKVLGQDWLTTDLCDQQSERPGSGRYPFIFGLRMGSEIQPWKLHFRWRERWHGTAIHDDGDSAYNANINERERWWTFEWRTRSKNAQIGTTRIASGEM